MAYRESMALPPLYITLTDSRSGVDDYQKELSASADFLACRQDCIWLRLFKMDTALPKNTKENIAARKQWMVDNNGLLKTHVKAIVNVVDNPFYEQASRIKMEKAYGVPGTCCRTIAEAMGWIVTHVDLCGVKYLDEKKVAGEVEALLEKN